MSACLAELVDLLTLERLADDQFLGQSQDLGWGQIFGGQVLGQALSAAAQTVHRSRNVHSLHAYFLKLGDLRKPILFTVHRVRDGGSFSTRTVTATQAENAAPIFELMASFQQPETGLEHADPKPASPVFDGPDGLLTDRQLWARCAQKLPGSVRALSVLEQPIELRPVAPLDPFGPERKPPDHAVWMRAVGKLPNDDRLHRCLLAYCSDFLFLPTAMRPHGVSWVTPNMQIASLDHAMWFHRPFRMDEWLLHVMHSPSAQAGRGLVHGSVFALTGELVASTSQEGLIRHR